MHSVLVKTISADKELCIAMQYAHNGYFFQNCFEICYLNFTAFQLAVYCIKLSWSKQNVLIYKRNLLQWIYSQNKTKTFQWYHILIVPKGDINKHYVQINNKYSFHLQNSVNEHDFLSVIEILQIINMTKIYEAVNSFIIVHAL